MFKWLRRRARRAAEDAEPLRMALAASISACQANGLIEGCDNAAIVLQLIEVSSRPLRSFSHLFAT